MNEEPETEEFDDEDADALLEADGEDIDVDRALRDIDQGRRKGPKNGEPAWRRLERLREDRLTAELLMDFEDYDIGADDDAVDDADDADGGDTGDAGESVTLEIDEPRQLQFG
jgi:hypothetical protein